jgi:hypothetical protein
MKTHNRAAKKRSTTAVVGLDLPDQPSNPRPSIRLWARRGPPADPRNGNGTLCESQPETFGRVARDRSCPTAGQTRAPRDGTGKAHGFFAATAPDRFEIADQMILLNVVAEPTFGGAQGSGVSLSTAGTTESVRYSRVADNHSSDGLYDARARTHAVPCI